MPGRVHACFRITAAKAGGVFPFPSRGVDDPLESLTAVEGVPNPAGIGGKRAGHAGVEEVWIRRIEPQALFETNPANATDNRMPEAEPAGTGWWFRCRETRRGEQDANGTKSESHEDARIKETGL